MKSIVAIALLATMVACAPAETRRSNDPGLLSGPVDGWTRGQFSIVRAEIAASGAVVQTTAGSVNFDGTFEVSLPEPSQVSRLASREGIGINCPGVRVEPADARGVNLILGVYDRVGRRQGALVQGTNRPGSSASGMYISRLYVDRETTVTGACNQESASVTYNLRLVAGWNLVITEVTGASRRIQTAPIPEGAGWYFIPGQ